MEILKKEIGFKYIIYKIKKENKVYTLIKSNTDPAPALNELQRIRLEDENGLLINDLSLINELNYFILENDY